MLSRFIAVTTGKLARYLVSKIALVAKKPLPWMVWQEICSKDNSSLRRYNNIYTLMMTCCFCSKAQPKFFLFFFCKDSTLLQRNSFSGCCDQKSVSKTTCPCVAITIPRCLAAKSVRLQRKPSLDAAAKNACCKDNWSSGRYSNTPQSVLFQAKRGQLVGIAKLAVQRTSN